MKNRFLLFFSLFLFSWSLSADNIPVSKAKEIASGFLKINHPDRTVGDLRLVYDGKEVLTKSSDEALLYVFENSGRGGFVIVAGDDIAYPVLGYSFNEDFPQENIPPHVKWWLEELENQIEYGRSIGMTTNEYYKAKATNTGEVVTQLSTAKWNQGSPYNMYVPDINGQKCWTGCVITAAAIVMKYHGYPEKGEGTVPAYTTSTNNISIPERVLGHKYDWDNMPQEYNSSSTDEQKYQVAQLMYDLGCMLQADYGTGGTSAFTSSIARQLPVYMDYDAGIYYVYRDYYSNAGWSQLIKDEIDDDRPVIYRGSNEDSGHAFVMDGYTSADFFSVNWGWGGSYNGYFLLDALDPHGSGAGGNNSHYNFDQGAILGMQPNAGGIYVERMLMVGEGLSVNVDEIMQNENFTIKASRVSNMGSSILDGEMIFALVNKDGAIKEILYQRKINGLKPNYGWSNFTVEAMVTTPLEIGDRIRMYFRTEKHPEWKVIEGGEDTVWDLLITDEFTIDETTNVRYTKETSIMQITTKEGVDVTLFGPDGTEYRDRCVKDGNVINIDLRDLSKGTYTVRLVKTFESEEFKVKL